MSPKPDTVPAPPDPAPERPTRARRLEPAKASLKEAVLEGTAPGRWLPAKEGEAGAFRDPEGRWQRWQKTGKEAKFSVHVHELAPGEAARISHVTTRLGLLPRDHGVVHWGVTEDGHLFVRPALPDFDLGLEVHLHDDGGPGG